MRIISDYINTPIELLSDKVYSIEIENRVYFYNIVSSLFRIANGELNEHILFYGMEGEINLSNKIIIINDYFNFHELFKSFSTSFIKYLSLNMNDNDKNDIITRYSNMCDYIIKKVNSFDLPFNPKIDPTFDVVLKSLKLEIKEKESIIENLYLLLDVEKEIKNDEIIFFINLKQYLNKEELNELYKYALYNGIKIILIDSQSYGCSLNNETKLVIDSDLCEIVL